MDLMWCKINSFELSTANAESLHSFARLRHSRDRQRDSEMLRNLCGLVSQTKEVLHHIFAVSKPYKTAYTGPQSLTLTFKAELKEPLLAMKIRGLGS